MSSNPTKAAINEDKQWANLMKTVFRSVPTRLYRARQARRAIQRLGVK